jgi:hypothetical protein
MADNITPLASGAAPSVAPIGGGSVAPLSMNYQTSSNSSSSSSGSSSKEWLPDWYLNGGQLFNLIREVNFEYAELETTSDTISVKRDREKNTIVVAIGENEGAAIITTAIIKKLSNVKIISRALSPIHDTVLEAMGIYQQ